MEGVLFQRTREDHVIFHGGTKAHPSLEGTSLLPLRGFHLKSFGNLNKSEQDADIDPLWSPTMSTEAGRFRQSSKELPSDPPSSPWSSTSTYSLFQNPVSSATHNSGLETTDRRHEHHDPVADQTREDFFFDCETNPYHLPSDSPSPNQNSLSPSESDSLQDFSPLSMQTTMTPPALLDIRHVDDSIWIKNSDDLAHLEDSAIVCKNPGSAIPPILVTPCDISRPDPFSNQRTLSVPHLLIEERHRRSTSNRIVNWRSTMVDTEDCAVASARNISAIPADPSRSHAAFSEIRQKSITVPVDDDDNESVLSSSETSEAWQYSTIQAFEDDDDIEDDDDTDDGSSDERSDSEKYEPSVNTQLSITSQRHAVKQPLMTDDNLPKSPLTGLSTVLRDLDVSEPDSNPFLLPRHRSDSPIPSETSTPHHNTLPSLLTPNEPQRAEEIMSSTSRIRKGEPFPGQVNEAPTVVPALTRYLLRTRRPTRSLISASRADKQSLSEDDYEVTLHTSISGKRKSARKSIKSEETDDDNFVPLKRQTKRARKAAPACPKRAHRACPSTLRPVPPVYKIPASDRSAEWQALKMPDGRFACNKCGMGFNRRHDLSRHWHASCIERPDMDSRLECQLCGKGESRKDALDRHLKTVHKR